MWQMAAERLQHPALNCRHTLQSCIHCLRYAICFRPCTSHSELPNWSMCRVSFTFTLPAANPAASGILRRKDARFQWKRKHLPPSASRTSPEPWRQAHWRRAECRQWCSLRSCRENKSIILKRKKRKKKRLEIFINTKCVIEKSLSSARYWVHVEVRGTIHNGNKFFNV